MAVVTTGSREIAIAIVQRDAEVLVGLRPPNVPLAGYWEFPGGKVEPGETSAEAAVRECLEETGVHVAVVGEFSSKRHSYEHATVQLRFFRCRVVKDAQPAGSFRWVRQKDLTALQFPEANAELIHCLARETLDK